MRTSRDRILTTHVGSLPRSQAVLDQLLLRENGEPAQDFDGVIREAVADIVLRQRRAGIDIVSDGEQSKAGYASYIRHRLDGFSGEAPRILAADLAEYPSFLRRMTAGRGEAIKQRRPCCTGPIAVRDRRPLEADLANFRAALDASDSVEGFMNAASPGVIAVFQPDRHYGRHGDYLEALAGVMAEEYRAIHDAGFILQIDCPDLAMGRHVAFADESEEVFLRHAEEQVEALNAALADVPAESCRMHLCWGNYEGPHHRDIPLRRIFRIVMKAKPQALLFEAANPRHAHEWTVFAEERAAIPDGKILIPGVIASTSNYIEHPELVAERICRFADIVGRERVMAGSDCGFSTFAGTGLVDPDICFAKLAAMAEGAELATRRLWGR